MNASKSLTLANSAAKSEEKPPFSFKRSAAEGLLPLGELVLVMVGLIFIFRRFRAGDTSLIQPALGVGGETTDPSRGRLLYMLIALPLGCTCAVAASVLSRKHERSNASWLLACAGGVMLWQAVGESLWHFGFESETGFANFPRLECAQGWIVLVPLMGLLIYSIINKELTFGMISTLGVFWANWFGHIVMIGTYPLAAQSFSEAQWYPAICLIIGIPLTALSVYGIFGRRTDWYMKHYSALLFFASYGMIMYGAILREV